MEDDKNWTSIIEEILVNLGILKEPWELKIRNSITLKELKRFISLLYEFIDVFAWPCIYMSGIGRDIAKYKISLYNDAKLVRQKLHRMKLE